MISVLLMAAALAVPVPAAHGALKPRLTLEGDPVVVRGYHFAALEHVHVTVSAHGRFSRDVVASSLAVRLREVARQEDGRVSEVSAPRFSISNRTSSGGTLPPISRSS